MKVLLCSYQAVANPGGGVFTQVMNTYKALTEYGIEVELFNPWKHYNWSKIDVIHLFSTDMRNYFLLKALPSSVPLIVSPIIDKLYPPLFVKILTAFSNAFPPQIITSYKSHCLAFSRAKIIVVRSLHEKRLIEKGFGVTPSRVRLVFNGVDEKFLKGDAQYFYSRYGLKDFVLYVGQIGEPRKNLLCLLKVAETLSDVEFVLIGPILETDYARRVLSFANHLKNVHVLGRLPEDDLLSAYAACKVFVLPSFAEGTGLAGLEAGLAGANVVITNRGGTPDYFRDFAIMVEPTYKSLLEGIKKALETPRNPVQRDIIKKKFLWRNVIKKLIAIYEEAVNK